MPGGRCGTRRGRLGAGGDQHQFKACPQAPPAQTVTLRGFSAPCHPISPQIPTWRWRPPPNLTPKALSRLHLSTSPPNSAPVNIQDNQQNLEENLRPKLQKLSLRTEAKRSSWSTPPQGAHPHGPTARSFLRPAAHTVPAPVSLWPPPSVFLKRHYLLLRMSFLKSLTASQVPGVELTR